MKELIEGKRVVVVGGSPKVVGTGLGEFIDDHDTVVRINIHWPCSLYVEEPFDDTEDIGQRTDLLFLNAANGGSLEAFKTLKEIKWVIFPGKGKPDSNYYPIRDYCKDNGIVCELFRPYRIAVVNLERKSFAGTLALLAILYQKPKEVFITGFDFYVDDYRKLAHGGNNGKRHDGESDRDYFLKHIVTNPCLKMADHVRESLHRDMPDVNAKNKPKVRRREI